VTAASHMLTLFTWLLINRHIHCVRKKRPKCFCNVFYRTWVSVMKFGAFWTMRSTNLLTYLLTYLGSFLNKFAAKRLNAFYLTRIMSLHYRVKLEMLIAHMLSLEFSEKETFEIFSPQMLLPHSPDLNLHVVDSSVQEYCARRCTKHASLIWTYRRH